MIRRADVSLPSFNNHNGSEYYLSLTSPVRLKRSHYSLDLQSDNALDNSNQIALNSRFS